MTFAVPPAPRPTVKVLGEAEFPVRRIYCVGRNYAAHAREMGGDPTREAPFFFMKPADAVLGDGSAMPYPPGTKNLHHEVELVVALLSGGRDIPVERALDCVFGYAVGLDMTRRDLQNEAKQQGRPWDMAKGFDLSAPIGAISPVALCGHLTAGKIGLTVDGALRQSGDLGDLIWSVPETIAYLSTLVALEAGDLIYTGTPDGVGPVVPGNRLVATIDGLETLTVTIA